MRLILISLVVLQVTACSGARESVYNNVPLTDAQDARLREAIALFDAGDLLAAKSIVVPLVAEAPDNATLLYEAALTLSNLGEYDESLGYAFRGLEIVSPIRPRLHHVVGINYSMLGDVKKAARALELGIAEDDEYYPLHLSLGVVEAQRGDYVAAARSYSNVLALVPTHVNGHLGFGQSRRALGQRLAPMLAYTYFLLLEPDTERSPVVRDMIWEVLSSSIEKTDSNDYTLNVLMNEDADPGDPTGVIEMIIAFGSAAMVLPEKADLTRVELLTGQYQAVLEVLSEKGDVNSADTVWQLYAPFFSALQKAGHGKALVYTLFQSSDYGLGAKWIAENQAKVSAYHAWLVAATSGEQ